MAGIRHLLAGAELGLARADVQRSASMTLIGKLGETGADGGRTVEYIDMPNLSDGLRADRLLTGQAAA